MKIMIRTGEGLKEVEGELVAPGLAITPMLLSGELADGIFSLTHIRSGYRLGGSTMDKEVLRQKAQELAALGNWDQPFDGGASVSQAGIDTQAVREVLYGANDYPH